MSPANSNMSAAQRERRLRVAETTSLWHAVNGEAERLGVKLGDRVQLQVDPRRGRYVEGIVVVGSLHQLCLDVTVAVGYGRDAERALGRWLLHGRKADAIVVVKAG